MRCISTALVFLFVSLLSAGENDLRQQYLVYKAGKPDFTESVLKLCKLADPASDITATRQKINNICSEARKAVSGSKQPEDIVERLNHYLFDDLRLKYNPDANRFFFGSDTDRE